MTDDTRQIDPFDRVLGSLDGLPDVVHTQQSTSQATVPLVGHAETYLVQTFRQRDVGDTIFLQRISAQGSLRLVIPPKVADIIARQREALTDKSRSKAARAAFAGRSDELKAAASRRLQDPKVRAKAAKTRAAKARKRAARKGGGA